MSLAVLGTDTGVGKTVVSALILARYGPLAKRAKSLRQPEIPPGRLAYWKPISTGGNRDRDFSFIKSRLAGRIEVLEEEYRFHPPVSPHLAARKAGTSIDLGRLRAAWKRHSGIPGRILVLEGVGGLLVPLNDRGDLLVDFIKSTKLAAVLVARSTLGTINHTLLSLEALRKRGIPLAGVVMDGPPNRNNREAIERFGKVRVVAEVPPLPGKRRPSRQAIFTAARRFDRKGALEPYLVPGGSRAR